jgi:hypothetical protein
MSFWRSDALMKVRASDEGRANITQRENPSTFAVSLKTAALSAPMGGISFLMEPEAAEYSALAIRYKVRFPADFAWACLGSLPGLTGKLSPQSGDSVLKEVNWECRGRWNKQGVVQFNAQAGLVGAVSDLSVLLNRKVQLHRQVWHAIEVVSVDAGEVSVWIDGAVSYFAQVADGSALEVHAVRMCLFAADNSAVADSAIELRDVCIKGEKLLTVEVEPHMDAPACTSEAVMTAARRTDVVRLIETETTVVFGPKEVHSLAAACLRSFLTLHPVVAHLIVVIAPPISSSSEEDLRTVLSEHSSLRITIHTASPFQNPYELRNAIVEQYAVRTKYTLHLNNDVFPHIHDATPGAGAATWLEELVACAEENPEHWAVMPLLLEKNSHRYGLHVWWDTTAVHAPDPTCEQDESVFYAKFDNDILLTPVERLPSLLASKLAVKPLLFLEDHCILARTHHFSPTQPLFDPRACYRREFFDLAWQIRARGGDVGMALNSMVVYEKVQPLKLEDVPYFLHRRQDELCFMSQAYLAHKWRIKYRTDCWHETQRSDALRDISFTAIPADFATTLALATSFLVLAGANRFCITSGDVNLPAASAAWQNMEELLSGKFPTAAQSMQLHFRQVCATKLVFPEPPVQVDLPQLRGIQQAASSEAWRTTSPAEVSAYCSYTIIRLTIVLPSSNAQTTPDDVEASGRVLQALEQKCLKVLGICSLVLQFDDPLDSHGETLDAYLWIKEDVADEAELVECLRAHVSAALQDGAFRYEVERASEVNLSRATPGRIVCWRYLPATQQQIDLFCTL